MSTLSTMDDREEEQGALGVSALLLGVAVAIAVLLLFALSLGAVWLITLFA